jgi:N-acetylglucosaminyl-diphospho-decaprenol L-rhamnosyltransferase
MDSGAVRIDVVVVAYNSADTLRDCVAPLAGREGIAVTVVDNASPDDSAVTVRDLPVRLVAAGRNGGFAAGCNLGIAAGSAPYVLLLNPDARLEPRALDALAGVLDLHPDAGLVGPRILEGDGSLAHSQRRFPRRRSTFAQALFLHRITPRAAWTDELVRDPAAYERPGTPDWVSGACMLIRRTALAEIGGLDESFFMYCEDTDLCARLRQAGWLTRYEPSATVRHEGGRSRPREELLSMLARNRVRYAAKHDGPLAARAEAIGVALGHATHALASVRSTGARRGHVAAVRAVLAPALRRGITTAEVS